MLILLLAVALDTPPSLADAPPAFTAARRAFSTCLRRTGAALPAGTAPETGARQVIAGCTPERRTLDLRFEAWTAALPAKRRAAMEARYRERLARIPAEVTAALARQARAATGDGRP